MKPKVIIILVNWNSADLTMACVKSLEAIDYPDNEVVIVDNGSADNFVSALKSNCPGARLILNDQNLGFAGGNNVGIRYAMDRGADYVLLLNNDTEVDPQFLSKLVDESEADPGIGIAGSKIYYYSEPNRLWFAGGQINYRSGDTHHIGEKEQDDGQYDSIRDTDYITGCSMLVKMKVFKDIGLLDESMFLYYEDSDFCARAKRHGYRIVFVPGSLIWHKVSGTTGKVKDLQLFYGTRNMLIFEKRNAKPLDLAVFLPYYFGKFVAYNIIRALLEGRKAQAKIILKAAYEGLTG